MKKIELWITKEVSWMWWILIIPLVDLAAIIYSSIAIISIKKIFHGELYAHFSSQTVHPEQIRKEHLLTALPIIVVLEETFFRFIPFLILFVIIRKIQNQYKILLTISVAIISSFVFGYLHGNILNIPVQGVMGILFAVMYLKAGGYNNKQPFQALVVSSTTHLCFNLIIFGLYVLLSSPPSS